jgi:hypothetical protein
MSVKTTFVCLALAASVVLITATAWWIARESQGERAADGEARASGPAVAGSADGAPVVPALDPDRSEVPGADDGAAATGQSLAMENVETLPTGTLRVNIVDAVSGEKVKGVHARLISERRYAEAMFAGAWHAPVSPGAWSGSLRAQGYEAMSLESFTIQSEKTTDLGTLAMRRGSGSIEGRVDLLALDAQQPLRAELRGTGRRGCSVCTAKTEEQEDAESEIVVSGQVSLSLTEGVHALSQETAQAIELASFSPTMCKACGFSSTLTQITFEPASGFKFSNLAAGKYSLQILRSDGRRLGKRLSLDLEPLQSLWVTVDATHKIDADFELETPSAQPFTGTLMKNGEWRQVAQTATYELTRNGEPYATATVSLTPPPPPKPGDGAHHELPVVSSITQFEPQIFAALGGQLHPEKQASDRLDRERATEDTLWPADEAPGGEATPLDATVLGPGRHRLLGLMPESLTLRVTAGYFASDPIPLELESFDGRPIKIIMHNTPHCEKDEEPKDASCISCHKEGAPAGG